MRFHQEHGPAAVVPRDLEKSGMLIVGSTGSGKTLLFLDMLDQIRERQERFIIHDPALEFASKYYRPGIDTILNPFDVRHPYWHIGDEMRHDGDAQSIARGLFPKNPRNPGDFFVEAPFKILEYLLTLKQTPGQTWQRHLHVERPRAEDIRHWMTDHDLLDRLLEGSGLEGILSEGAPQQRGGVHGALDMVAEHLAILPDQADTTERWSAREWATQPGDGCIFLTSTAETRGKLVKLHTLWIDMLILRLMSGEIGQRATWFLLDELSILDTIPQLHTAVTENRKWNSPMVIGTQDPAQLEARYGIDAKTILSQFATRVFLRLGDEAGAKWASGTLGDVETQRLEESRRDGWFLKFDSTNLGMKWQTEPIALPSEISGLADRTGYIKIKNFAAKLVLPYVERPKVQPGFIERPQVTTPRRVVKKAKATTEAEGSQDLHQSPELALILNSPIA